MSDEIGDELVTLGDTLQALMFAIGDGIENGEEPIAALHMGAAVFRRGAQLLEQMASEMEAA